jgi:hypothetical protein
MYSNIRSVTFSVAIWKPHYLIFCEHNQPPLMPGSMPKLFVTRKMIAKENYL